MAIMTMEDINIGCDCLVPQELIPDGVDTGIKDIEGNSILTRDIVEVNGTLCENATVGIDHEEDAFVLIFGTYQGSFEWYLTQESANRRGVRVVGKHIL